MQNIRAGRFGVGSAPAAGSKLKMKFMEIDFVGLFAIKNVKKWRKSNWNSSGEWAKSRRLPFMAHLACAANRIVVQYAEGEMIFHPLSTKY
jgi:hypothetical protein